MCTVLQIFYCGLLAFFLSCDKGPANDNTPVAPPTGNTFSNPLLTSGPDPWVIKNENFYYYTHTLGNRIAVWRTEKMSDLGNAGSQTIWTAPASGANSKNIWAPELHFIDNKWYAYYTAGSSTDLSTQRTFVLENSGADPRAGTWTEKGKIADTAADYFAIDGTVFEHEGISYFIWSGHANDQDETQRIYIATMSNPFTLSSSRSVISSPEHEWETHGSPPAVNEAPQILVNPEGEIFLIYSASGCWTDDYALGMLSLKAGGDPLHAADWIKSPMPVFTKNINHAAYGPGHNAFFKSADGTEDWIIYHANSSAGQGCNDFRNPRMQEFTWNPDGTPDFGQPAPLGTRIEKPSGE